MRVFLLMCLFACAIAAQTVPPIEPGVSEELAKWRSTQYSNISYKLNLTLEKMSPVLKGTIEIRVTVSESSASAGGKNVSEPGAIATGLLPPIILDWRKIPGHEKDSTISNVTLNGIPLKPPDPLLDVDVSTHYEEFNDHLVIRNRLRTDVKMGENVIKLDFTSPILTSGSAVTRYIDKEDGSEYIYSLFVPSDASTAFPVFDQPDLKARFQLTIQTTGRGTEPWTAVSNTETETSFSHTWGIYEKFKETQPISTYVFAFAVGDFVGVGESSYSKILTKTRDSRTGYRALDDFKQVGDTATQSIQKIDEGVKIYLRRSQLEKFKPHAAEVFRLNREAVKYLETYFDYKFPFPKYDLVLIPEFPFGGMEHAGATFLREDRVIFPAEPTANDYITRANVIFHEAAHQWFGDCVTMRWFDDLWLKEGFAEFMAYKTLEKVMPEYNAWKVFYERNKQAAYATDSTKGTTAIYQPIRNLSAAKSAYGNIVYRKAPSFLRQAEFYLGEDKFQTAVRAFLKKHEFANAGWEDLVKEFETASGKDLKTWAEKWVKTPGAPILGSFITQVEFCWMQRTLNSPKNVWEMKVQAFLRFADGSSKIESETVRPVGRVGFECTPARSTTDKKIVFGFANYQDYGYGIFLLDDKSRDYVLKNIQNEKDPFLRSMMWGALWDSVREAELDPSEYVELVIKQLGGYASQPALQKPARSKGTDAQARTLVRAEANLSPTEIDETTIQTLLGRVSTALNYYLPAPDTALTNVRVLATDDLRTRFENMLLDRLQNASTAGQRVTYFRAFVNNASTERSRNALKQMLSEPPASASGQMQKPDRKEGRNTQRSDYALANARAFATVGLRTKDKFDIVTRLAVLGDADAPKLLADLEKTETSDDAKRYAYAAHAAFPTAENKAKFFNDFLSNKDISESWIESAIVPFNSVRHADLTQQYLTRALSELPNLKRTRKIFFIGNWLAAFIGGQRDEKALEIINKFLADTPNLDNDLRLKVLENSDVLERAVKIGARYKN